MQNTLQAFHIFVPNLSIRWNGSRQINRLLFLIFLPAIACNGAGSEREARRILQGGCIEAKSPVENCRQECEYFRLRGV